MPEFKPGEQKIATVPMSNPTVKAFDYSTELYMGTNLALMAQAPFHLDADESKNINLPITMPLIEGTYPVYIGVFSNGQFIEPLYQATEDVVIAGILLAISSFHYVYQGTYTWGLSGKMKQGYDIDYIGFKLRNNGINSVDGISVRFWIKDQWTHYEYSYIPPDKELSPPLDRYKAVISQPFTLAPGSSLDIFYYWRPYYHTGGEYGVRVKTLSATAVAEVYVDNNLIVSGSMPFTVSY